MAQDKKDPDNVFVTPGKKDASKSYVFVPFNYRDAQAALKGIGATWAGSQWQVDAEAFKAGETAVREAARKDIALGVEGRKAREDALKADKPKAEKAEKAPKAEKAEKAPKAELTAEEKAAKAEAARAAALVRDASRFPVKVGAAKEGDALVVNGADVTVTKVGREFELDAKGVADLADRFGGVEFAVGDKVAYASFEAPKAEKDVETEGPSA